MKTLSLRIPDSLHKQVKELAGKDGISINQFITTAVAEKMSAQMTETYLQERAKRGDRAAFDGVLSRVKDVEPEEADRLP